ncbi:MAG: type II toxin-antitoxin system VapC family toxin [Gemmataceae bacterium]
MILLDTDHLTILRFTNSSRSQQLLNKMNLSTDEVAIPIIAVEETMRGWISAIAKERQAIRQVFAYRELGELFDFFGRFQIVPFESSAAQKFDTFNRIRIGTTDRKIAAIALVTNSLLLTANTRDFGQIPGLKFENWLT